MIVQDQETIMYQYVETFVIENFKTHEQTVIIVNCYKLFSYDKVRKICKYIRIVITFYRDYKVYIDSEMYSRWYHYIHI